MCKDLDIGRIIEIVNSSEISVIRLQTEEFDLLVSKDGSQLGDQEIAGVRIAAERPLENQQLSGTAREETRGLSGGGGRQDELIGVADGERSPDEAGVDSAAREREESDGSVSLVRAPLLGTFYRAPQPGAPPFVEVGTQVDEETTVGLLEAMKLFTAVHASARGVVEEVLVENAALVEYGQPLLRIRESR